jgi:acyl-CoA thioesterase-1
MSEFEWAKGNVMNPGKAGFFALMLIAFSIVSVNSALAQIVALGASNTQGKGVSPAEAWPALLERMLQAKGRNVHVVNAGISGDTTGGMLARLDSSVPEGTTLVIVNFGGNDFKRGRHGGGMVTPEARHANMAEIIGRLHSRHIRTIVADGIINSARAAGMVQVDGIHLTEAGHQRVASQLIGSVR